MATLTDHSGLEVLSSDPSGEGGRAIQDNFKKLVDWQIVAVLDKDLAGPPATPPDPAIGDRYIVASPGTGDWAGEVGNIAEYDGSAWVFTTPSAGQPVYVMDEKLLYRWDGTAWQKFEGVPAGSDTEIQFNDSGVFGANANFTYDSTATALEVDNLKLDGNTISATDTNGDLILSPNGTGAIQVDSTGNDRGTYAFDLQIVRGLDSQVASGNYSFAGGINCTASGPASFTFGSTCTASALVSFAVGSACTTSGANGAAFGNTTTVSGSNAIGCGQSVTASGMNSQAWGQGTIASGVTSSAVGYFSKASQWGQQAHACTRFSTAGDAQASQFVLYGSTSDATPTVLKLVVSTSIVVPDDTAWMLDANIVAAEEGMGNIKIFRRQGVIVSDGTYADISAIDEIGNDQTIELGSSSSSSSGGLSWDVSITADDPNKLQIEVTGEAATNIRWVARLNVVEVSYPST